MVASNVKPSFNPWPWSIIGVFGLAAVAAVVWVGFCVLNGQELVAADYYEQEVVHQEHMDRAQRALALGDRAAVAFEPESQSILVRLPAEQAAAKPEGHIQLYRPSEAGLDQTLPLNLSADGTQRLGTAALKPGLWRVRVTWSVDGKEHLLDEKVTMDAGAPQ